MVARTIRWLGPLGSTLVALVLSHSVVYLVRYGSAYGEALAHNGHDAAWSFAVWSAAVLAIGVAVAGLGRLLMLGRAAARIRSGTDRPPMAGSPERGAWLRGWLGASIRLAIVTAALLTAQENIEHLAVGLAAPGPAILITPAYPFALAIVAGVSLAVSLVIALYRRRRDTLLARLRGAARDFAAADPARRPAPREVVPPASLLGRLGGLRAPPVFLPG